MVDANVPLERKFSLVTPNKDSEFDDGLLETYWTQKEPKTWTDLESEYRVIVLADAGAGKTHEALNRAQRGDEEGRPSLRRGRWECPYLMSNKARATPLKRDHVG